MLATELIQTQTDTHTYRVQRETERWTESERQKECGQN